VVKAAPNAGVVGKIEEINAKREERRAALAKVKNEKKEKTEANKAMGIHTDVDFEVMIDNERFKEHMLTHHVESSKVRLCVNIRKRPLFPRDIKAGEIDAVSCANPSIKVHEPKFKVDGITKYIENHSFNFDNAYNENETTDTIYEYSLSPLIDKLYKKATVTVFAYGQTGSGKTYTMKGIHNSAVNEIFSHKMHNGKNTRVFMSFFEIYGGKCFDLLNKNNKVRILEDKNHKVQIPGLTEHEVDTTEDMHKVIEFGHDARTTHKTKSNDTSSRSHAICYVTLKDKNDNF
jgi:kinesin family protein 2/24